MSEALRGVVVCHGNAGQGAGRGGGVDQRRDRRRCSRSPTPAATATRWSHGWPRRSAAARRSSSSISPRGSCLFAVLKRLRALPGVKVVTGVNLAMLVDFVFHVSPRAPRPPPSTPSRPEPERSGPPDGHRALSGGRPADPWTGGRGMGPPARRQPDRAGGRPGGRERLGAGPLPHGGDAGHRGRVRRPSRRPRPGSATGRPTRAGPWCSPATSRRWPRSTPPTR